LSNSLKHLFDILVSALGMLLLAPFFGLIARAIKRDSPGPVFYRGWVRAGHSTLDGENDMKISYNREEDILMIETAQRGAIDHAEHTGQFIAHFSETGSLLLLEILDASELLSSLLKVSLRDRELVLPVGVGK